jgi:hypothetical protein
MTRGGYEACGQDAQFDFGSATDEEISKYYNRNSVPVNVARASTQTAGMKASVKQSVKPNIYWTTGTAQQIEAYEDWLSKNSDAVTDKPKPKPKVKPKPRNLNRQK